MSPQRDFAIGDRVEAPGFTTYPRMIVVDREWRHMDIQSGHLRGWWLFCDPDPAYSHDPGLVDGRLLLHPSWLVAVAAVDLLGDLAR